jgi:hypothetical protein
MSDRAAAGGRWQLSFRLLPTIKDRRAGVDSLSIDAEVTTAGEVPAADPKTTTSRKVRFAAEIDRRLLVALHGVSLAVLGVVLLRLADASIPWIDHLPLPWWVIAASFFVVEATALHIEIRRETHTLSLSGIPLLLGLLSLPPLALLLARLAGNTAYHMKSKHR